MSFDLICLCNRLNLLTQQWHFDTFTDTFISLFCRLEWVEILEPRSGEPMFVNLITGECGWDEPLGVTIKRLGDQDGHQWWELYDVKSSRFYYYNVMTQQTCWQKPRNSSSIIIPLAKFQLLRQQSNTTTSSTSTSPPPSSGTSSRGSNSRDTRDVSCQTRTSCISTVNSSTQTTPPPSLKRQMCFGMSCGSRMSSSFPNASNVINSGTDTWSAKRSLRTYLINEARSARGLTNVNGEEVSDYDEDFWESDDDEDDYDDDSTSDQWDADDEIDHNEDDGEDDFDDEEDDEIEEQVSKLRLEQSDSIDTTKQSSNSTSIKQIEPAQAIGDKNNNTDGKKATVSKGDEDDSDESSEDEDEDIDEAINEVIADEIIGEDEFDDECETDADIRESLQADSSADNQSNYGSTYIDTSFVFVKPSNLNQSHPPVPAAPPVVPSSSSVASKASDSGKASSSSSRHPHHISTANKSSSFNGLGQFGLTSSLSTSSRQSDSNEQILETVSDHISNTANGVSYAVVDKSSKHARNLHLHSSNVGTSVPSSVSAATNLATSASAVSTIDQLSNATTATVTSTATATTATTTSKSRHHHHHHHHHHHPKHHSSGTNVPSSNEQKPLPPPHQVPIPPQRAHSLTAYDLSLPAPPKSTHSHHSHHSIKVSDGKDGNSKQYNSVDHPLTKKNSITSALKSKSSKSSLNESASSAVSNVREQIMEKFARENVARHIKRGVGNQLLKRKTSLKAMLSWSKNSIKQPMIATLLTSNSSSSARNDLKNESIHCFKLIQMYMGDRAIPESRMKSIFNDSINSSSTLTNGGQVGNNSTNSLSVPGNTKESIAFDLITTACNRHELRDEIYVQLCRQTTNNPKKSSLISGLELMACCLCYFPPSVKFSPYLASFLTNSPLRQVDESGVFTKEDTEIVSLLDHCYKLLAKMRGIYLNDVPNDTNTANSDATTSGVSTSSPNSITSSNSSASVVTPSGGFIYCRKPVTPKELEMVGEAIERRFTGIFGESLDILMDLQRTRWPHKQLPWILTTLCEAILKMGGVSTEGIFRIAADTDELSFIKLVIDCINFDLLDDDGDILDLLNHSSDEPVDVHVFACLLKQWFRSLKEPVIPTSLYESCLQASSSAIDAIYIVTESLPPLNKLVLGYLIRFLQVFSAPENSSFTKMDQSNLSMVWSPNILRSPFLPVDLHPSVIFENTRKEMTFIRTLIQSLDTSFIQGVC